jgi:hypothetical protein
MPQKQPDPSHDIGEPRQKVEPQHEGHGIADRRARFLTTKYRLAARKTVSTPNAIATAAAMVTAQLPEFAFVILHHLPLSQAGPRALRTFDPKVQEAIVHYRWTLRSKRKIVVTARLSGFCIAQGLRRRRGHQLCHAGRLGGVLL